MIDFINPRSKKTTLSIVITFASIAILALGINITYKYVNEYRQAKVLANINTLPSGDIVIEGLDINEILALYENPEFTNGEEDNVSVEVGEGTDNESDLVKVAAMEYTDPIIIENDKTITETSNNDLPTPVPQPAPSPTSLASNKPTIPQENILIVPQMGVNGLVYEGQTESTLSKGFWRMPMTSNNPTVGNMVITSHRYLRRPPNPNTFYLLDKVKVGDQFYMYWQGKRYDYKVREIKIIEPDQIDILYNTPTPQLTLFSCTPLFTSDKRLVVIADLL